MNLELEKKPLRNTWMAPKGIKVRTNADFACWFVFTIKLVLHVSSEYAALSNLWVTYKSTYFYIQYMFLLLVIKYTLVLFYYFLLFFSFIILPFYF